MADPTPYIQALSDARARIVGDGGLGQRTAAEMRRALAQMLVDLNRDVENEKLTARRAERLRANIERGLQRFRDQALVVLEDGRRQAIEQAVEGHTAGLAALAEQAPPAAGTIEVGGAFADVPEAVLQTAMTRRAIGGAETFRTLINRNVQEVARDLDDVIESGVGRGVSQQRLTKGITEQLTRNDPELKDLAQTMGRERGVEVEGDEDPIPITEEELDRAQRLEYDARRIAVTEINSHYHEADVIAAVQSPVIDLLRWQTSSQHTADKRYVPDVCDFLEAADVQGYGPGLYHPAAAPSHAHPFCQCRYEKVFFDPEDYGSGMRDLPRERELSETDVEDLLTDLEGNRSITEKYVKRQREVAQQHLDAARSVAEELVGG